MIIRLFGVLFEVLVLYLLQSCVFPSLALAGVVPDLLLILVVSVAFMRGKVPGLLTGFVCGLMIDCTYSETIGLFALLYMIIGYCSGFANKIYDENDNTLPLILTGVAELVYNVMYFFVFFMLKGKLNFGFYLYRFMIPRILYTVVISILLYKLLNICNVFLMRFDRE